MLTIDCVDAEDSPPSTCSVDLNRDCGGGGGCIVSAIAKYVCPSLSAQRRRGVVWLTIGWHRVDPTRQRPTIQRHRPKASARIPHPLHRRYHSTAAHRGQSSRRQPDSRAMARRRHEPPRGLGHADGRKGCWGLRGRGHHLVQQSVDCGHR